MKPDLVQRPSARLLVVDPSGCVLLFRFVHGSGALAGRTFWATPGGAVDEGESFEQSARRELEEETGLILEVGQEVGQRRTTFPLASGQMVQADERYFLVRAPSQDISRQGWTDLEREVMAEHRWWSHKELATTSEQVFPEDLLDYLRAAGVA
ncbi:MULTISPECIES: NUDIX domain-containing protein [unclassified Devosia]|uniref:NUDIX hydrolase n=1 Tax=unclassified Devosia TaxID=196773 RepID=UPI001555AD3D|nr:MULTISPECIES: NUDIX domain-containing protein [unclassified Devosia]